MQASVLCTLIAAYLFNDFCREESGLMDDRLTTVYVLACAMPE